MVTPKNCRRHAPASPSLSKRIISPRKLTRVETVAYNKDYPGEMRDELQPEYDLRALLKGGVRGKYVTRYRAVANLVLLDADVA